MIKNDSIFKYLDKTYTKHKKNIQGTKYPGYFVIGRG